ncbi:hypothetical protein IW152_004361 [Coemansia sp. BCRC 34962]|nr:hypothetical protein IW152_004361 [Coemansia sp. BCRC 34962]
MSVPNLEGHPEQRTELDDWESLLYVLCWVATFGINADDREILAKWHKTLSIPLKISLWHADHDTVAIADDKRNHLHSLDMFITNIAQRFPTEQVSDGLPDYSPLSVLAIDLYSEMFQNSMVDGNCRGALKINNSVVVPKRAMYRGSSSKGGVPLESLRNMTIQPSKSTGNSANPASSDPFVNRTEPSTKVKIISGLKGALAHHATFALEALSGTSPNLLV